MNLDASIIVSVSNHYKAPSYASELVTQGILGERVQILEPGPLFTKIRQRDGYISWADSDQVMACDPPQGRLVTVRDHFIRIFEQPSENAEGISEAVVGSCLAVLDEQGDWYQINLPWGRCGWAKKEGFGTFPDACPDTITALAREFSGYQYFWGGRTPKGFDCSGFVQTVFALSGIVLPRDSVEQQRFHRLSLDYRDAQPGDLLFFGKTPEKVTHVAISLGDQRFIHASGWVRLNSLSPEHMDFSPKHVDTFISVNRYPFEKVVS